MRSGRWLGVDVVVLNERFYKKKKKKKRSRGQLLNQAVAAAVTLLS